MDVRDIWLIAAIVYLGLCLLNEVAYPMYISKKKAVKPAYGGFWSGTIHMLWYVIAWFALAQTFHLFWDIYYYSYGLGGGAFVLPFALIYLGAYFGRRRYRIARGLNIWDRDYGMPPIYRATLGKLGNLFRGSEQMQSAGIIYGVSVFAWVTWGLYLLAAFGFLASLFDAGPLYVGDMAVLLTLATVLGAIGVFWHYRHYTVFLPDQILISRVFGSAKILYYQQLEFFRVIPTDPDAIHPDMQDPSKWRIEVKIPGKSAPFSTSLSDPGVRYLIRQIAFRIEQERWADMNSPADREQLLQYHNDGRIICTTKGHKPAGEFAQEAAYRASFKQTH